MILDFWDLEDQSIFKMSDKKVRKPTIPKYKDTTSTKNYAKHRLQKAGTSGTLMSSGAARMLELNPAYIYILDPKLRVVGTRSDITRFVGNDFSAAQVDASIAEFGLTKEILDRKNMSERPYMHWFSETSGGKRSRREVDVRDYHVFDPIYEMATSLGIKVSKKTLNVEELMNAEISKKASKVKRVPGVPAVKKSFYDKLQAVKVGMVCDVTDFNGVSGIKSVKPLVALARVNAKSRVNTYFGSGRLIAKKSEQGKQGFALAIAALKSADPSNAGMYDSWFSAAMIGSSASRPASPSGGL